MSEPTDEVMTDSALLFGLVLDGQGGARPIEWEEAMAWQPAAPGSTRQVPAIPDDVAILGVAQNLLSAVLIFLFLLALRNHFRIK